MLSLLLTCCEAKPFHEVHAYTSSSVSNNTVGDIVVRLVSVTLIIIILIVSARWGRVVFTKIRR